MKIDIIGWFEKAYSRLPNLSSEGRLFIVKILPFLSLVFGLVLTIIAAGSFLSLGIVSSFTLDAGGIGFLKELMLGSTAGIIQGILMIFAFPSLRARHQRGWRLLFWSQILLLISSLIFLAPWVFIPLVFLYPLFQVKSHYE